MIVLILIVLSSCSNEKIKNPQAMEKGPAYPKQERLTLLSFKYNLPYPLVEKIINSYNDSTLAIQLFLDKDNKYSAAYQDTIDYRKEILRTSKMCNLPPRLVVKIIIDYRLLSSLVRTNAD